MNTCEWCRTLFAPTALRSDGRRNGRAKEQRFCSRKCNGAAHHAATWVHKQYPAVACAWCSTEFTPIKAGHRFCSHECNNKGSYRERVGFPESKTCYFCGTTFDPLTRSKGKGQGVVGYCSSFCRRKAVVLSMYHVTGERLFKMLADQGGRCASGCGTELSLMAPRGDPAAVQIDHDHKCCPGGGMSCGRCIRGLMCPPCNQTLGWAESGPVDPIDRLTAVMSYLLRDVDVLTTIKENP